MKGFCPKSGLIDGGAMTVWATVWATCDTARLVGLLAMARQIAAPGAGCVGAAWPVWDGGTAQAACRSPNGLSDVARIGLRYYGANATGVAAPVLPIQHG